VAGVNITLTSDTGSIGAPLHSVTVDTNATTGKLTLASFSDAYVNEASGDLTLNTVTTGASGTAFIQAPLRILNGSSGYNVTSGHVKLFAGGDIGASGNALKTTVSSLEGTSSSGEVWINNYGDLTVNGAGVVAQNGVNLTAHSPIDVTTDIVSTTGDIILTATDGTLNEDGTPETNGGDDNLTVETGINLKALAGSIVLQAGDNLTIAAGAILVAAQNVTLAGD
jgi:hypothetical protein